MQQPDLFVPERLPARDMAGAIRAGDRAIALGAAKATRIDPLFVERACAHVLSYLAEFGVSSGELLTDSCKLAGVKPADDRHFGLVFRTMLKRGLICWAGACKRAKGHASRGGSLYRLSR